MSGSPILQLTWKEYRAARAFWISMVLLVALADALSSGDLNSYQAEHRRLAQRPMFMSRMLLSLDRFPKFRRQVLRTLEVQPALFAKLLAMHVGSAGESASATSNRRVLGLRAVTRLFPGDAI